MNLITSVVRMEIVWRQCEESYFLWRFYGKIFWRLPGVFMEKTW